MAQRLKHLPAMRETWVQSLGWEDPLEKGKATYSSILENSMESPWGHKELDTTEQLSLDGGNAEWSSNFGRQFGGTLYFPGGSEVKASACNAGDMGLIPGSGRSTGEGNGNPLQYSCLENPMDGGAWRATVHGVAKSRT